MNKTASTYETYHKGNGCGQASRLTFKLADGGGGIVGAGVLDESVAVRVVGVLVANYFPGNDRADAREDRDELRVRQRLRQIVDD